MRWFSYSVASVLLGGCATPYWYVDMPHYRPARIDIIERADLNIACGQSPTWDGQGCAYRHKDWAVVYVKPGLNDDQYERLMHHEFEHLLGKNHDNRQTYRLE